MEGPKTQNFLGAWRRANVNYFYLSRTRANSIQIIIFVLPQQALRLSMTGANDPRTILRRAFGAVIACFVCAILAKFWKDEETSFLHYFGCSCEQPYSKSLKPILTTVNV
uniref:Uncharacterized protein n=1 Tax=Romanomermis culicivorax TaxID=13658 RepID=A0A915KI00_ROMCU